MKTLVRILLIWCTLLVMSASLAFSQAKINLYLTEGSCSVTHWHYKVTIKFFTGANCTGNYDFCYFISDDDYEFGEGEEIYFNDCNLHEGTYFQVYVCKYEDPGGTEKCKGWSQCYQYYENVPVYVTIAP